MTKKATPHKKHEPDEAAPTAPVDEATDPPSAPADTMPAALDQFAERFAVDLAAFTSNATTLLEGMPTGAECRALAAALNENARATQELSRTIDHVSSFVVHRMGITPPSPVVVPGIVPSSPAPTAPAHVAAPVIVQAPAAPPAEFNPFPAPAAPAPPTMSEATRRRVAMGG